ncbi:MAG: CDP-glycerol glycerophosphotransferase family protein, partial [Chlamydiia bacterium]|nr:CDP-glycerol glycerophosphotransferase family protein [Chlamydiia bacterium]
MDDNDGKKFPLPPPSWGKGVLLLCGRDIHHLDHLAPLASLWNSPLIITDLTLKPLVETYYPDVKIHFVPEYALGETLVTSCDTLISCLPRALLSPLFFLAETIHQKTLRKVWCPHGNSDKGHASQLMEGLIEEKNLLFYGNQMVEFLKEKGAYNQLEETLWVGNYRRYHYSQWAKFYRQLVEKQVFSKFKTRQPILLYAPTWEDGENSSSYANSLQPLTDALPSHWNLLIKPHYNLTLSTQENRDNLLFLPTFPPIYPLIQSVDAYLGDMSSIGYDFLTAK